MPLLLHVLRSAVWAAGILSRPLDDAVDMEEMATEKSAVDMRIQANNTVVFD